MTEIVSLSQSLAVLVLSIAGLCSIVGAKDLRDRCLRIAVALFFLSLFLPHAFAVVTAGVAEVSVNLPEIQYAASPAALVAVVGGHLALGIFLLRRKFFGAENVRREAQEIERARSRERPRLPPEGGV